MFIITWLGRGLVSLAKTRLEAHTAGLRDMIVGFSFTTGFSEVYLTRIWCC